MTSTASDVSSLARSLSHWEYAEYVACAFVAIACAGEYIADFTNWLTAGDARRKLRLAKRSTLLLIVSLAVELFCLVQTNSISGQLIGSLSDKATNADTKAQSALDKSGAAETKAGDAGKKADEAEGKSDAALAKAESAEKSLGKAESEARGAQAASLNALNLARGARQEADSFEQDIKSARQLAASAAQGTAAISSELADRTLTDDQVASIASKLSKFAGQRYTVVAYWQSPESLGIANRVHQALGGKGGAGWLYFNEGSKDVMMGGVVGIFVSMHPDADETTKQAAAALIDALHTEGLKAEAEPQNPKNNPKHNDILMKFGAKR
jgi:hypothetical protein